VIRYCVDDARLQPAGHGRYSCTFAGCHWSLHVEGTSHWSVGRDCHGGRFVEEFTARTLVEAHQRILDIVNTELSEAA
jgi:hypothetical protein